MRRLVLAMALTFGATLSVMSNPVEASGPFIFPGTVQGNGPRPFSTVRSRELQAARYQRLPASSWFQPTTSQRIYRNQVARPRSQWSGVVIGPRPGALFFRTSKGLR